MELKHEFSVPRPIDQAWAILTDVEGIAPCLPGAQLTEVEGDTYRGTVKVKVGPIVAKFAGQAAFRELDAENHRMVLDARGRETGGKGLASALVTAQLTEQGDSTLVQVSTDLTISGKIAQFGRSAMADISARMLGQFADCLEQRVLSQESTAPAATAPPAAETEIATEPVAEAVPTADAALAAATAPVAMPVPAVPVPASTEDEPDPTQEDEEEPARPYLRRIDSPEAKPVDLFKMAGAPLLKITLPIVAILVIIVVLLIVLL
jgi:carbon monoxide dehydrogenase subunit G